MHRIPEYSFHVLEEQSSNIADNLLVKYDKTAKEWLWEEKAEKKVVSYVYCEELMKGFLQNIDQNRSMSNSNNSFSMWWKKIKLDTAQSV